MTGEPRFGSETEHEGDVRLRLGSRPNADKLPDEDFEAMVALTLAVEQAGPCELGCGLLGDEYISPGVGIVPACPVHGPLAPDLPEPPRHHVEVFSEGGVFRTKDGTLLVPPKPPAGLSEFTLQEFVDGGFLYFANRQLHMFGLALMVDAREVCKVCGCAQDDGRANHRGKPGDRMPLGGGPVNETGYYPHPYEGELRAVDGSLRVVRTSDPSGLMFSEESEESGRARLAAWIRENWRPDADGD